MSKRPKRSRSDVPLQVETRSRYKERYDDVFASAENQLPVMAEVCKHLPSLADIMALARCNKKLYARINQCYPELEVIRKDPPNVWTMKLNHDAEKPIKQWSTRWNDQFDRLIRLPQLHRVVFQYCCEAMLWSDANRAYLATCYMHIQLVRLVKMLYTSQRWDLLEFFISHVASWQRMSTDARDGLYSSHTDLPEVIVIWANVAEHAIDDGNMVWLRKATYELRCYYIDVDEFGLEWYDAACPYSTDDLGCYDMWRRFHEWLRRVLVPCLKMVPVSLRWFVESQTLLYNLLKEEEVDE
jgi:hypothetical protein